MKIRRGRHEMCCFPVSVLSVPLVFFLLFFFELGRCRIAFMEELVEDYASTRNRVSALAFEIRKAAQSLSEGVDREKLYGVERAEAEDSTRRALFEHYDRLVSVFERERASRTPSFSSAGECLLGEGATNSALPLPPASFAQALMRERVARMSLLRAAVNAGDDARTAVEELRVSDMVLHGFLEVVYSAQYSAVIQTTLSLGLHLDTVSPMDSLPSLKTTALPTGVAYLNSLLKDYFAACFEARNIVELAMKHVNDVNLVVDVSGSRRPPSARGLARFYAECLARVESGLAVCLSPSDPAKKEIAAFVRESLGGESSSSSSSSSSGKPNTRRLKDDYLQQEEEVGEEQDANPLERADARLETLIEELKAVLARREKEKLRSSSSNGQRSGWQHEGGMRSKEAGSTRTKATKSYVHKGPKNRDSGAQFTAEILWATDWAWASLEDASSWYWPSFTRLESAWQTFLDTFRSLRALYGVGCLFCAAVLARRAIRGEL